MQGQGFAPRITSIKGMSERRRLPRYGKVRLGIKVPNKGKDPKNCECHGMGCFKCTHPIETPYFVVPPEVAKIYGDKPVELDIMIPVEDEGVVFPQSYKWYGSSRGLKCQGNLEIAYRYDEELKGIKDIPCPCEHKDVDCKPSASLQVILYKVTFGGVYQISSGSQNSMIDVASGFDYARCLIGRVAMVPLKLRRVPTETHHDGKKQIHYPLRVVFDSNDPDFINTLREQTTKVLTSPAALLPPPEEERPDLDGPVTTDWTEETQNGTNGIDGPKKRTVKIQSVKIRKIEGQQVYVVKDTDGHEYLTMEKDYAQTSKDAMGIEADLEITFLAEPDGNKIQSVKIPIPGKKD